MMSVDLGKRESEKQDESMSETSLAFVIHRDSKAEKLLICFLNVDFLKKVKFFILGLWCKTQI